MSGADPWDGLPLPALRLDGGWRIIAINEAAEAFLNTSRRLAVGQDVDGNGPAPRIALDPPLRGLVQGRAGLVHPDLAVTLMPHSPRPQVRRAALHLAAIPGGGWSAVLVPDDAARSGPALAAKAAARSAIGMAEMLAHEIKNPLAGIQGAAQLLAMELEGAADLADLTTLIVDESRRIVALLDRVGRFGDTSPPALAPVNLHDVLERARLSAQLSFAAGVRIVTDYDPSLPPVEADADQLMQLVLNLLRNAAEALAGVPQAEIRIRSLYDGTLRRGPADGGRPLPIGLEIEDNGPGLPEAIADRVFDPFVSGRENGTGLGLALVAKIAADHGAFVAVDSRPGRTVFRVSLPMA